MGMDMSCLRRKKLRWHSSLRFVVTTVRGAQNQRLMFLGRREYHTQVRVGTHRLSSLLGFYCWYLALLDSLFL